MPSRIIIVNTKGSRFECARLLHERMLVPLWFIVVRCWYGGERKVENKCSTNRLRRMFGV